MQSYILRETIISMAINSLFSLGFFLLIFGHAASVPVWGIGAFAFDTIPQSIAIAAMSTLVPGAITLRRLHGGKLAFQPVGDAFSAPLLPRNIWARALVMSLLAALHGGLLACIVLLAMGMPALPWWPALIAKLAYGAGLAAIVTPPALRAALQA